MMLYKNTKAMVCSLGFFDMVAQVLQGYTCTQYIFIYPSLRSPNINRSYKRQCFHINKAKKRWYSVETMRRRLSWCSS